MCVCVREKGREEESTSQPFFLTSIFEYFYLLKYKYAYISIRMYANIQMCMREKVKEREEESMSQPFFLTSIFGYFDLLKYVYACVLIHMYINILTCVREREKGKGREYVETFLFDKYLWVFLFVEIYLCR